MWLVVMVVVWLMGVSGEEVMGIDVGRVAARCVGEGSHVEAVRVCACSVRHRLEAGWRVDRVLDAYYAPDVGYSEEQYEAVRRGLSGECVGGEYFYMSVKDARRLGFRMEAAVVVVRWGVHEVVAFRREEWGRRVIGGGS